jgi:hypothetical protein
MLPAVVLRRDRAASTRLIESADKYACHGEAQGDL